MLKICELCNKEFKPNKRGQIYCSRVCSNKSRAKGKKTVKCNYCNKDIVRYPSEILDKNYCSKTCLKSFIKENHQTTVKCNICGKEFVRQKSHADKVLNNYCSYECSAKGFSKNHTGENHPGFLNTYTECAYCHKEIYRKRAVLKKNKNSFCSSGCKNKWESENLSGINSHHYNENITDAERVRGRKYYEYRQWRIRVYERDEYTCQICGFDNGGILNAHHLNGYNWDKKNRTNVDNAVTLCELCHSNFHNIYGYGNNTKEQFQEHVKTL